MIGFILAYLHYPNLLSVFIKLFGITLSMLYILFSLVIIRQISQLRVSIEVHDNGLLDLLGKIQLIFAIILFIYSIIIL
ncbi:hypothetical protein A3D80_04050 [Candidatus Roizmanbacteria bacterium RIFCSPHIGHO2_02_FULL_40_13b]|nr:MAG: hypothetical protein A3D80_04050 [Candidatus Roizmanbacteria bacterium RIFCSPHIGHO2_02_FULL_40_13b]OGK49243.1 MAG: hypothetical protein A3A56_04585 [Candidatus Roizmanbacteria bacterium RIFCSPLOWO2_01_FULL_40_32]OGK57211.1 MAG: hypothetical protein A3H83_03105 [Candidatus Roizmanbacteria bacterium RIFCSPLOWO2_02_FULL_39_8]